MKPTETQCSTPGSKPTSAQFVKVLDGRNHPVRGLWIRGSRFYAQISAPDPSTGINRGIRRPLEATTLTEAKLEMAKAKLEVQSGNLTARPKAPALEAAIATYVARLKNSGKTQKTQSTESGYLSTWTKAIGTMPIGKLRAHHVRGVLDDYAKTHAARSTNLLLITLRNVLTDVVEDGFLPSIPADIGAIKWRRVEHHSRRLIPGKEIDRLLAAAPTATKNSQQLIDYVQFLRFSGAREKESLRIRWEDVNFHLGLVTLGGKGGTKARKPRHLDMNSDLQELLKSMAKRRDPESSFVFPSPQRGNKDIPARSFRESLKLSCKESGIQMGFHDLRHFFISHAVMAGIDFMTIARWVGHADGGVLIGKVYGHLHAQHTRNMASKLSLSTQEPNLEIA